MPNSSAPADRRAILGLLLSAGASCAATSSPTAASSSPNAEADSALIALGADLDACDALKSACPDEDEERYDALFEQHWVLREQINAIPATTMRGLSAKARAAELALKWDGDGFTGAPGDFSELCKSICRDILSMTGA